MRSKKNVIKMLSDLSLGLNGSPYRQSLKIIQSLITDKRTKFEKIWCQTSKQPIVFEDGKIYFNNHTHCLSLCGYDSLPSTLYKLKKNTKIKKFEDVFIYSGPIYTTPLPREDYKPYFFALTSDNWLIRYDNISGKVMQKIYLGSVQRYSFRHIDWETQGETIVVQSTLFPGIRTPNQNLRVVQAVAVFKIMPIRFVALFEINQTIFGKEVNSANISEGLLIVGIGSQNNAKIRIYSLNEIIKETNCLFEASLNKKCDDLGGKVGEYPFGLPLNYKIATVPPVLFEVRCSEQNLHFGGYPFHYVFNPSHTAGVFEVRDVATNQLLENGCFDVPNNTTEADTLSFHSDDSGRLIYESANYIKFYKIFNESNNKIIRQQFELKFKVNDKNITNGRLFITKINGQRRAAKNICYTENPERQILASDFENELELFLLLGINTTSRKKTNGMITICDNETGETLHEFQLGLTLDEMSDYSLIMDLDTIVITNREIGSNKFECHIYRMTRDSYINCENALLPDPSDEDLDPRKRKFKDNSKI